MKKNIVIVLLVIATLVSNTGCYTSHVVAEDSYTTYYTPGYFWYYWWPFYGYYGHHHDHGYHGGYAHGSSHRGGYRPHSSYRAGHNHNTDRVGSGNGRGRTSFKNWAMSPTIIGGRNIRENNNNSGFNTQGGRQQNTNGFGGNNTTKNFGGNNVIRGGNTIQPHNNVTPARTNGFQPVQQQHHAQPAQMNSSPIRHNR